MTGRRIEGNRNLADPAAASYMPWMQGLRWMNLLLAVLATVAPLAHLLELPNLLLAVLATVAPLAHLLELPNKLALDGPLWLAVQQHLYRGWGPFVGAPSEIGALLTTVALAVLRRRHRAEAVPLAAAGTAYAAMLATFFLFNAPVCSTPRSTPR